MVLAHAHGAIARSSKGTQRCVRSAVEAVLEPQIVVDLVATGQRIRGREQEAYRDVRVVRNVDRIQLEPIRIEEWNTVDIFDSDEEGSVIVRNGNIEGERAAVDSAIEVVGEIDTKPVQNGVPVEVTSLEAFLGDHVCGCDVRQQ